MSALVLRYGDRQEAARGPRRGDGLAGSERCADYDRDRRELDNLPRFQGDGLGWIDGVPVAATVELAKLHRFQVVDALDLQRSGHQLRPEHLSAKWPPAARGAVRWQR